jgi:hypothetical protein
MSNSAVLHLPDSYRQQVQDILQQHIPGAEVLAYGSRVRGDHYEASDLDLAVRFPETIVNRVSLMADLREAFIDSNLPIIVQVVDWQNIPQAFRDEILAGYVVLQSKAE